MLFESLGDGQYADVARPLGCDEIEDSRGVAVADFNGDGRLDLAINNNAAAPTIYFNNLARTGNWMRVELQGGAGSGRDALGARLDVEVDYEGQPRTLTRWIEAGSGYASQHEFAQHIGLGAADTVRSIRVKWPSGSEQQFAGAQLADLANKSIRIVEGVDNVIVGDQPESVAQRNQVTQTTNSPSSQTSGFRGDAHGRNH